MELQQLQMRNQDLAILNAIAQGLNREVELEKAMTFTLRQTVKSLNLKTGWIWLLNSESKSAYIGASYNLPPVFVEKPELLSGNCYCLGKYLTDNLENATNISEITCTRLVDLTEGTEGLRYHASVPLFGQNAKLGILNVVSPDSQELSEDRLKLLYTIGDMLSIAIERGRSFENSRRLGISEERHRLAREIHDTLAQSLTGISLQLETIQALLETSQTAEAQKLLARALDLTRLSLEESRRSVLELRAAPLQGTNLVEALEQLIGQVFEPTSVKPFFEVVGTTRKIPARKESGLYRVTQEAVQNVIRHSNASECQVILEYTPGEVILTIRDNGKGFDPTKNKNGFGLVGMNERMHLMGGSFILESSPGHGTLLQATTS